MNIKNETEQIQLLWQPVDGGARILRVFGNTLLVSLPDSVEGRPVTEIGAYCFSASEHLPSDKSIYTAIEIGPGIEKRIEDPTFPAICGKYVEQISLPDSVKTLHNAAFYNCRKLNRLSVGRKIDAIGSDVFMNCIALKNLRVRGHCDEASGLFLILERLITELEVFFCPSDHVECALLFPEYYEWLDEISPAHIFSRSIEGEGFRMRRAFQDKCIDFHKYDQFFSNVLTGETDRVICRMALNRLRYPCVLAQNHKEIYENALKERYDTAINILLKNRDLSWIIFMNSYFSPDRNTLTNWMNSCISADWGEASAYLMEEIHKKSTITFREKTFDFEEF